MNTFPFRPLSERLSEELSEARDVFRTRDETDDRDKVNDVTKPMIVTNP